MSGSGRAPYQDVIEIVDADHYTFKSRTKGEGGEWVEFMVMRMQRTGRPAVGWG